MSANADSHHHGPIDWPQEEHVGEITAGKLGMWIFLLSDAFSFSGLLLAYGIRRGASDMWRCSEELFNQGMCSWLERPEPELGIPFTAGLTFLLICSSVSMVMAYAAVVEKDIKGAKLWLGLTVLGGALFLCGQMQEYFGTFAFIFHHEGLIADGLIFGQSNYATTFYAITAFHGMHVLSGVIFLSVMWIKLARGHFDDGNANLIEIAGLFWHFVDLVWILVFTLVYLIPL